MFEKNRDDFLVSIRIFVISLCILLLSACSQQSAVPVHELYSVNVKTTKAPAARKTIVAQSIKPSISKQLAPISRPIKTVPAKKTVPAVVGTKKWQWPTQGKIIKPFSLKKTSLNKGINIAGRLGQPIVAATSGQVVFSGDGGLGNGKMLIIQHKKGIMTIYTHNQKLWVKKGQKVHTGQKIATMGQTGTNRVQLHFEIRIKGKAVNPARYLP